MRVAFGRMVLTITALAASYEWFVDEAILSEAIAAIAVAVVAAATVVRVRAARPIEGRVSFAFLPPFVSRIPFAIVRESYDILGPLLWRGLVRREHVRGRWIALRYARQDVSAAHEHGRRTIVIFGSNLTPNALPLDIDPAAGRFTLHQLVHRRESAAGDPRYPM